MFRNPIHDYLAAKMLTQEIEIKGNKLLKLIENAMDLLYEEV